MNKAVPCNTGKNSLIRGKRVLALAVAAGVGASAPAWSQQHTVLEEIIVTASKKSEFLSDVPVTVNVVTGEQLDEFKVFQFEDVEKLTAGLDLQTVSPRSWSVSLRGAPYNPDSGASPTVVTYWNGVLVNPIVAFQQLFDIERIEVLRGAQGTVQGATSPSGSIQIHTRKANGYETGGYLRQSFVDDGGSVTEVAATMPLVEGKAGIRFAGVFNEDPNERKSITSGEDGLSRTKAGRLNLFMLPTDNLDVSLTYEYLEQDSDALAVVEGITQLTNGNPSLDAFDQASLQEGRTELFRRNELVNLTVNYSFADHTLTWVSGYQDFMMTVRQDMDFGNIFPGVEVPAITDISSYERWSHEIRFTNNNPEFWEYLIGAYYDRRDTFSVDVRPTLTMFSYNPGTVGPVTGAPGMPSLGRVGSTSNIPANTETVAAFANNKFYFTNDLTLTVGARWQSNTIWQDITSIANQDAFFGDPAFDIAEGTVVASMPAQYRKMSDEAVTGTVRLAYDMTPGLMVYGSYGRSYRPGGSVTEPTIGVDPELIIFDGETSNSFELGFKQVSSNGRYQINGAVYYQAFKGFIQRSEGTAVDLNGDGILDTALSGGTNYNADAIIRGAELEATALLTPNWRLFSAVSYNDAKFDDASVPCGNIGDLADPGSQLRTCQTDGRLGPSPNWSASVSSEYTFPGLMFGADAYVRGLYQYTGERNDDLIALNPALYDEYSLDAYGVWNLYLGLRAPDQAWEVSLWARNLLDEEARIALGPVHVVSGTNLTGPSQTLDSGYNSVSAIPERSIGITGTWRFGDY